uniref:NADH dehydrogenase subunit 2 n=1 Tax=Diplodiscus mehrai TaxID=1895468 RepID=A0A977R6G5_9TREM|nr:NADH dehydrogenase subunit 2 [Diplodiscus mehrai]UXL86269.1 NADH dehydrogenase subunit 2 [Diplodiscus mehrai]
MRGYLISLLSIAGVVFFSFCLFFSSNLSFFWLFLELGTLCLIPCFFMGGGLQGLSSLFSYLVVSSVSSSFIVCGVLFQGLFVFMLVGLLIKFGIFPFFGWVYKVVTGSNWWVVWGFSTMLKSPFLFFCYFVSSGEVVLVNYLCCLTFLVCSFFFWLYSLDWFFCWTHMMLVSSGSLVAMAFVLSYDTLLFLFLVYIFWGTCVILFFGYVGRGMSLSSVGLCFVFSVLVVSWPLSLAVFYKLLMGSCIFACSFVVFAGWVVYTVSEQFYLLKYLMGVEIPKSLGGMLSVV